MNGSLRLFCIFDIQIKIHVTFWLLPLFFAFIYSRHDIMMGLRAFVLICLVFVCVLLHELSHSLMAKRYGINVPEIILLPIGGMASMHRIPRQPKQELLISLVGPLFNFAFAAVLYFPLYYLIGPQHLFSPSLESWPGMIANLFWINPILGAFNLIPAFPMDGGRILRSLLALKLSYWNATRIAVFFGRLFAILFAIFGIWTNRWMLVLIAVFVYFSAEDEQKQVLYEETMRK